MKTILATALLLTLSIRFGSSGEPLGQRGTNDQIQVSAIDTTGAKQFWDALALHCGKAFAGEIVGGPAGEDFKGKALVMHLRSCNDNEILIPFNVGDNRSRTWVLKYDKGRIELKHDHRQRDGGPDTLTMYGGTTTNDGLPHLAVFPADGQTAELIPAAAPNVWWITIDGNTFTYNLRRLGTDRLFSVAFDLSRPIEVPEPSWGWE